MERIDGIVGNVHADDALADHRDDHDAAGTLETVVIDADNRRRSRFRATTDRGTDVGVVLDRPAISSGDVLLLEDDRMIVVAFEPRDALAVTLPEATPETLAGAVELGHRVGNQHWDLAIDEGTVYVPLSADRHIVERVVTDVVPDAEVAATTVSADLFVTETADAGGDREHGHGGDHEHSHGAGGDHSHDHGHGAGGDHSHSHDTDDGHSHDTDDGHSHDHSHDHGPEHSHDPDDETHTHDPDHDHTHTDHHHDH